MVRLDHLAHLPNPRHGPGGRPLRVAVAAIVSPEGTLNSYRSLLAYLGHLLGRGVELVQRRTYWEVNDMISRGEVDLAFVCTGAYLQQGREHIMSILVVPQIHGRTTYKASVIVAADSRIKSFDDLKGKVFAFTDPLSNTGYLFPMDLVEKRDETVETFFKRTIFTYSHDRSIQAVVDGVVDGASVDNIVYENTIRKRPRIASLTRVIEQSREFGMPPVVVPKGIDKGEMKRLRAIFLNMDKDPEGRAVLNRLGMDRFVLPLSTLYEAPCLEHKDQPCTN